MALTTLSFPLGWQVLRGDEEQLGGRVGHIRDQSGELCLGHTRRKHLGSHTTTSPSLFAPRRGHQDQGWEAQAASIRAVLLCGKQREDVINHP